MCRDQPRTRRHLPNTSLAHNNSNDIVKGMVLQGTKYAPSYRSLESEAIRDSRTQPNSQTTNIIFVGAGAVGCFYASRIHAPDRGVQVSLVARSNYQAIAQKGIELRTRSFGDYHFKPSAVFSSIDAVAASVDTGNLAWNGQEKVWHYIVLTTKALPDRQDDATLIAPLVRPESCIILIQNGVGVEAPFRLRFPNIPIVSGVTTISAEQIAPGIVRQNRWTRLSLGPYGNGTGDAGVAGEGGGPVARRGSAAVETLCRLWGPEGGGIRDVEGHDEQGLQVIRWHKLCINAVMNTSAVLSGGLGNAEMLADDQLRQHILGVMNEIYLAIPQICGVSVPHDLATPEQIIKSIERNHGAKSSMLLDWEANRPLEIEVILGNPLRIAAKQGVNLPRTQTLYALLRSAQRLRSSSGRIRERSLGSKL